MTNARLCHPGRVSLPTLAQRDACGMTDARFCHPVGVSLLCRCCPERLLRSDRRTEFPEAEYRQNTIQGGNLSYVIELTSGLTRYL